MISVHQCVLSKVSKKKNNKEQFAADLLHQMHDSWDDVLENTISVLIYCFDLVTSIQYPVY